MPLISTFTMHITIKYEFPNERKHGPSNHIWSFDNWADVIQWKPYTQFHISLIDMLWLRPFTIINIGLQQIANPIVPHNEVGQYNTVTAVHKHPYIPGVHLNFHASVPRQLPSILPILWSKHTMYLRIKSWYIFTLYMLLAHLRYL